MGFNKSKFMEIPRDILIGTNVLEETPDFCDRLNFSGSSLVLTGPNTIEIAGNRVDELLISSGFESETQIVKQATRSEVNKITRSWKNRELDFLVGVGGGKTIDVTKVVSDKLGDLPFVSVPTATSHDGIASGRASILDEEGNKVSVSSTTPIGVIADTSLLSESPWRLTASGIADIISNYTAVKDWHLAKRLRNVEYSSYAAALSEMTAETLLNKTDSLKKGLEETSWVVAKGLISSGVAMSIAGSSRPASGSEHKFSHMLDRIAPEPALHGEQCGVGTIIMMYLHDGDWKKIKNALRSVGAPTDAKSLGIEKKYIIEALQNAHKIRPERYTILGDKGLTKEAAIKVAEKTGVI
ncbi:MAG: Glycerol dehydrogenase family enzyme GldA [Candidatus Methanohalarchaeum thermophilum]|uniref:Glycerol-1-phosphate dehydrogenase [NAD(P)+] n=1 Tax=Methanohalarchaeum thermophilum TaxID=1903181 RepID=A0A1Q6DXS3_METT1|nr:MAG: Glycerol dehydrogenase family enzyme GldA [Candidatus Methanohalarchaeum thermophilum]